MAADKIDAGLKVIPKSDALLTLKVDILSTTCYYNCLSAAFSLVVTPAASCNQILPLPQRLVSR